MPTFNPCIFFVKENRIRREKKGKKQNQRKRNKIG